MHYPYEDDRDNIPGAVQTWIDTRMANARTSVYRGTLQVLSSGFGKGLLITAAIAVVGTVALAVFAPASLSITATGLGAKISEGLLIAGNGLLSSTGGLLALLAGGTIGSLAEAYTENSRISKDSAQGQAELYAKLREREKTASPSTEKSAEQEMECNEMAHGHCARLMQEKALQDRMTERGIV